MKGKRKEKSTKKDDRDSSVDEEPERIVIKEDMMKKHMPLPFPKALHGKKGTNNASEIFKVLRQVKVNIPLLDMIKQVPTYAKFLKDLYNVKRGLNVNKKAFLTEQVSSIIRCKSPVKYKDPSCLTISMSIGGTCVEKALLDLGASVNLLPYSVYKQLGLGELKPTSITLSRNRVMKLTFGNMTLELNIFHLYKKHIHSEEEEGLEEGSEEGLLEPLDFLATLLPWRRREEILPLFNEEETQRLVKEEPPKLILKPLPIELKYAYLEEDKQCPVVISSALTIHQEDCLLEVLRRCKKAIGWQIFDLKGISPLVCTHHIYMEDEAKPVRQPQRRLNPHMQKVVRAEVLKLLQVDIIYPISDSPWASPTQVVPKKSRIKVAKMIREKRSLHTSLFFVRVCIDYRRLNVVIRKDHFPLPFIDQVLERVSEHPFYCFLDGYSGYFQIEIDVEDQGKITFTCPFGTYAYRRMPFGLYNAPATFQRCMLSIFNDMVEHIMEFFMDDITIYGSTFDECLINLEVVLN
ncbi:Retrovirus-related Pol polyprotein from transposon 297 [Vitis vinifera]|uniref:Retrovirus-related Pol polyprotein from transposon 297 n=1 Tax=Vitis vinifera TaxID=29760 RepID=A0A438C747_VITVI|nr:Retrovirus-related Pol polyprotein from transposon 297 [Vitis vinifera]